MVCVGSFFFLPPQGEKECLTTETCELKQKVRYLQDQLVPLTKQREYQEKEIQRLNRVGVSPGSFTHTEFNEFQSDPAVFSCPPGFFTEMRTNGPSETLSLDSSWKANRLWK